LLRFYAQIVDHVAEGVGLVRGSDEKILYANPAVERIFGYAPGELIGRRVSEILVLGPETAPAAGEGDGSLFGDVKDWHGEMQARRKDGQTFWMRANATTVEHPEFGEVWLGVVEDITARKHAEEELLQANRRLEQLAYTDVMTGLPNRRCFLDALSRELSRLRRHGGSLAVALADVDNFKAVNDAHGHLAGDRAMSDLACLFRRRMRESDLVARFGGDEFVVLMPQTDAESAVASMDRLREEAAELQLAADGESFGLTISVGVSVAEGGSGEGAQGVPLIDLLHCTDQALYSAKRAGRNRTIFRAMPAPEGAGAVRSA
jgi:diguanylate cyclase (GGDEF)-like protein/PAS domain S-box-containing protein